MKKQKLKMEKGVCMYVCICVCVCVCSKRWERYAGPYSEAENDS